MAQLNPKTLQAPVVAFSCAILVFLCAVLPPLQQDERGLTSAPLATPLRGLDVRASIHEARGLRDSRRVEHFAAMAKEREMAEDKRKGGP